MQLTYPVQSVSLVRVFLYTHRQVDRMPDYTDGPQELAVVRVEGFMAPEGAALTRWNNVHHFVRDAADPLDQSDPEHIYTVIKGLAEAVYTMHELISVYLSNEWAIRLVRAQIIQPFQSVFTDYVEALAGEEIDAVDEPDDAMVITKRTFKAGRSFQGRLYLPGIPDSQVAGGLITQSYVEPILAEYQALCDTAITAEGEVWRWVVFSPTKFAITPTVDACTAIIQTIDADRVMRRQSRRDIDYRIPMSPGT